jgi:hypothetical protein
LVLREEKNHPSIVSPPECNDGCQTLGTTQTTTMRKLRKHPPVIPKSPLDKSRELKKLKQQQWAIKRKFEIREHLFKLGQCFDNIVA